MTDVMTAPSTSGALTDRDVRILEWVTRHGVVTTEQIGHAFFSSIVAAYRRVKILERTGLIRKDRLWVGVPYLIHTTKAGVAIADCDLQPAAIHLAQVKHSLAIVDLSERLLNEHNGAVWVTERELRRDRMRAARSGERWERQRRTPDGMLVLQDGKKVAVEVDLTPKRTMKFEILVQAYAVDMEISKVWWYLPNATTAQRMRAVAEERGIGHLFETKVWEGK